MNAKDLTRYKQTLVTKRREIEAQAIRAIGAAKGPGEKPTDIIDQAIDATQADLQVHLLQTDSRLLRAIDEALQRIARGTFGVCQACGKEISMVRLGAVPWTRLCHDCKEQGG